LAVPNDFSRTIPEYFARGSFISVKAGDEPYAAGVTFPRNLVGVTGPTGIMIILHRLGISLISCWYRQDLRKR